MKLLAYKNVPVFWPTLYTVVFFNYTVSQKKHPRHFQLYLENQLSNFNNFWHKYS